MMKSLFIAAAVMMGGALPAHALDPLCVNTPNLAIPKCPENSTDWYDSYESIVDNLDTFGASIQAATVTVTAPITGDGSLLDPIGLDISTMNWGTTAISTGTNTGDLQIAGFVDAPTSSGTFSGVFAKGLAIGTTYPAATIHLSSGALLIDGDDPTPFKIGESSFSVDSDGNSTSLASSTASGFFGDGWMLENVFRLAVKTVDQSDTLGSLISDSDLILSLDKAYTTYYLDGMAYGTRGGGNKALVIAFGIPTGSTMTVHARAMAEDGSTLATFLNGNDVESGQNPLSNDETTGVLIKGIIELAATTGDLQFKWKQSAADANAVTLKRGSFIRVQRWRSP